MKTAAQKFFAENGYYLARSVYAPEDLAALAAEFDRVVRQVEKSAGPRSGANVGADNGIVSTFNVQKYSSLWLTKGLLHPGFLDIAEQFIGPDIVLQRTSLYEKRRSDAVGPFRMHQDWIYGPMRRDTMVAGMIHVAGATAAMGALRIYPGTHKTRMEDCRASDDEFSERFPLDEATVIEAEAGDVLFFHYCLVHGSMSNRTAAPRKVVHARMFSGKDCRENPDQPFENLVLRGWNDHVNADNATSANV